MPRISRRDFLELIGAAGIGVGAGFLYAESTKKKVELLLPQVVPPEEYSPGVATWFNTVCTECPAGCGVSVRIREGRAKKIEGNPLHPVSQGRLCARGQAGLNALYNPDRIRTPLRRTGERGSGGFEAISWDEALLQLSGRLGTLKIQDKGARVHLLTGNVRGHLDDLLAEFMDQLGSDNYLQHEFAHPTNLYAANRLAFATDALPYYDIGSTDYLLSFGADYLGTWLSPVHYGLAYGHLRQGGGHRGKCVQIEPRMSLSGASADEWVPAKPGTEGLLALGLAHHIVDSGRYSGADRAQWVEALRPYSSRQVAEATGVSADRIDAIAGEFAGAAHALAIAGGAAGAGTNAVASLVAVNALNYLVGNLDHPGGLIFNKASAFPDLSSTRQASYAQMAGLVETMGRGEVEVLLLHDSNPVFTLPGVSGFAEAMDKVPLVASLSSFMDDTTALADLVLPAHTYLESWGDDVPQPGVGFPVATISQPVVTPVFDTRALGDIILALAHQIGGELPAAMPWRTTEAYIRDAWQEIYSDSTGETEGFQEFWVAALEAGVWGQELARRARDSSGVGGALIPELGVEPPEFEGTEQEYPFVLHPYVTATFYDGRGANLPWLQELPDPLTSVVYASWVELNPKTARKLSVSEGDVLEVRSAVGTIRAPAFIYEAIRPDVVAMPIGQGHSDFGRYASGRGANPIEILAPRSDEKTGALAWAATRVAISKTGQRVGLIKTDGVTRDLGRNILGGSSHA